MGGVSTQGWSPSLLLSGPREAGCSDQLLLAGFCYDSCPPPPTLVSVTRSPWAGAMWTSHTRVGQGGVNKNKEDTCVCPHPLCQYHTHLSVFSQGTQDRGTRLPFTEKEPRELKELVQRCTVTNGGPEVWPASRACARPSSAHTAFSGTSHLMVSLQTHHP